MDEPTQVAGFDLIAGGRIWLIGDSGICPPAIKLRWTLMDGSGR
jgi:hypothetical protein